MARAQIWRTALGLLLVVLIYVGFAMALFAGAARVLGVSAATLLNGSRPEYAALFFLTFLGFHLGLWLVVRLLHRRSYVSLAGPDRRLNLRHFGLGCAAIGAVMLVLSLSVIAEQVLLPDHVRPRIALAPTGRWLAWLAPALGLIFVQIMAEEALFRGYLLQQLRARFRNVVIWAILPSFLFGTLHFDYASYGANAYLYVLNTTAVGIITCLVTMRTGNLGAAAGLHFGNNAFITLFGVKGDIDGFSLITMAIDLKGGYMAYSILTQTMLSILAFGLWWGWMNRNRPIAKATAAN